MWGRQGQLPTAPQSYRRWAKHHDATADELADQVDGLAPHHRSPADGRPRPQHRRRRGPRPQPQVAGASSRGGRWEALVVIPPGSHGALRPRFPDPRIRWVDSAEADPWDDVNRVEGLADDPGFLVFLEAGDELAADCFYQVASHARRDPLVDLVYWDDDVQAAMGSVSGFRHDPRFRPGWSPDMLVSANYVGRSFAIRPARFVLAGGAGRTSGRARLWEMLLRSQLDETRVSRVTRVLSHLHRRDDAVDDHGLAVVTAHLAERGVPAEAAAGGGAGPAALEPGRAPPGLHRDPHPPQPAHGRPLPGEPGPHRLPRLRRGRHRQRPGHARERGLVRALRRPRPGRPLVDRAVQLLRGQQPGRGQGQRRRPRLPQRRHRDPRPGLDDGAGRLGHPARHRRRRPPPPRPRRQAPARGRHRRHGRLRRPRLRGHGPRRPLAAGARPPGTATCWPSPAPAWA